MAAQLYENTQVADCLYEVLNEMVENEELDENLAKATLNKVSAKRPAPSAQPTSRGHARRLCAACTSTCVH